MSASKEVDNSQTAGIFYPKIPQITIPESPLHTSIRIQSLLANPTKYDGKLITVSGWSKTVRKQGGGRVFIEITDGTDPRTFQIVVDTNSVDAELAARLKKAGVSYSFKFTGFLQPTPQGDSVEMSITGHPEERVLIYGDADQKTYPLAKKAHSYDFLRSIQHLRPRSYIFSAVNRIRSELAFASHYYLYSLGLQFVNGPIITTADCEGAGEMFGVTSILPDSGLIKDIPATQEGKIDYAKDFFGQPVFLTVSNQLALESITLAIGNSYTFGNTFRAEVSHTSRHLAEFSMCEVELVEADLPILMQFAENHLKFSVSWLLERAKNDLDLLESKVEPGLVERLQSFVSKPFIRISYTEAVDIIRAASTKVEFESIPVWGDDLCSQHEKYLTDEHFKGAVIVYDYPFEIKAFYMKVGTDMKTVRAMDVLVPRIGEIIGGSEREATIELLEKQCQSKGINAEHLDWYFDLRKYGTMPHAGYGLGFERLVMMCTGVENIRDVIPFPRTPGSAAY